MHLIITEKHSTAKRIAQILSDGKVENKKVEGINIYEYPNTRVVGLSGHILNVDFPPEYNNWSDVEPQELIGADIILVPTHQKIISALQKLAKDASRITIATDYDREGELIGVEALKVIPSSVPTDRVRYSAITPSEITKSFSNPTKIDFNLASSGEARQKIDLVWGAALTRFVSLSSRRLGKNFLSVGRVQTPLLALLVKREKAIAAFEPTPYWEVYVTCKNDGEFIAKHVKGRFLEKGEAERIISRLGSKGTISKLTSTTKTQLPPAPFDTTEFLREASAIGFTPANAMSVSESLYINGWTSYPRTDNTVYPESLDYISLIKMFTGSDFGDYAASLLKKKVLKPTRGRKKATDHPPIHPVSVASKKDLNAYEWKIYELIVRRFFATFASPAVWEKTEVTVEIDGELFEADGSRLIEEGWLWYYPYYSVKETILPSLKEGETLNVLKVDLAEKETQPPKRYKQGGLIKKMEDLGLGTKSTRHEMISKLYARGYVYGNPVRPTSTANAVIETLEKYAAPITKPDMTCQLDKDMDRIAEGTIDEESVVQESREMLDTLFEKLNGSKDHVSRALQEGLREDKIVGKCPDCGSDLMIRRSKRGRFIGCTGYPDCSFSLPLPKSGNIIVTSKDCEEHGLHHLRIVTKGRRPWDLGCPYCNYIEWQKSKKE
ncbi:MAG: DNA topoisomerase I [Methanocellales archaeon]|nr:DNA topoisomerase I [Methanocellales archaeon]MDD5447410.1 DNA topoisomerase I [Methanocellales archaeon]